MTFTKLGVGKLYGNFNTRNLKGVSREYISKLIGAKRLKTESRSRYGGRRRLRSERRRYSHVQRITGESPKKENKSTWSLNPGEGEDRGFPGSFPPFFYFKNKFDLIRLTRTNLLSFGEDLNIKDMETNNSNIATKIVNVKNYAGDLIETFETRSGLGSPGRTRSEGIRGTYVSM